MPAITEDSVYEHVHGICFKTGPPGLVGAEAEWLVTDPSTPDRHVPLAELQAAVTRAGDLPSGSAISYEPGGQLELSTLPYDGVSACRQALQDDLDHVSTALDATGLTLTGLGLDPVRTPRRQLDLPRYLAMEAFFDVHARADAGRSMMCSTAGLQICLDIGRDTTDAAKRWRLAHALGPVLVAAFANSPVAAGRRTGWRSTRQAIWARLDPGRCAPARHDARTGPADAWAAYALDARMMCVRGEDTDWSYDPGFTLREWIAGAGERRPTADDLEFHLSTLFPPVRPRGWLELRMIDAQDHRWWPVPLAVVTALVEDPMAGSAAAAAAMPVAGRWREAARYGPADPPLRAAVRACLAAAERALPGIGADPALCELVSTFIDRYADRGRCPADDVIEEFP
ncbi:MAG: ergothioneine biosynthesis glutamate--cysteine ligase EgtA [Streptosporangiales bacterium]|nr:ergothioneine biosynthesis glutamate--cysteine ligase EgtA [Streptosporangiales bacterium]